MKIKATIFLLFFGYFAKGQIFESTQKIIDSHPESDVVILSQKEHFEISNSAYGLKINRSYQIRELITNERAILNGENEHNIYHSSHFENLRILEAATLNPKNAKNFTKTKVEHFETESKQSQGVFLEDTKLTKLKFPALQVGSICELNYEITSSNPFMLPSIYLNDYQDIKDGVYSVSFPSDIKMSFKTYGDLSHVFFKETKKDGITTWTWSVKEAKGIKYESNSPGFKTLCPQVHLMINEYMKDGKPTEVLSDVDHLFKYYNSLVEPLDFGLSEEMQVLVKQLTEGKSTEDKVRSIYYWVQDHVHYVAFEVGMGGFVPREPKEVYNKKFGDCKDMASLLTAMLSHAGVDAYLGWIGTRDIPFTYAENPTQSADNHMIAVVKLNNNWVFLDATDSKNDLYLPTNHIIGKECLVRIDSEHFTIVDVPVNKPSESYQTMALDITINGNQLNIHQDTRFDGYWKEDVKYRLASRDTKARENYLKSNFQIGNNKTKVVSFSVDGENEREKELKVSVDYLVSDMVKHLGNEIYINAGLYSMVGLQTLIEKNRKYAFLLKYPFTEKVISTIHIPAGYELSYLPESQKYENADFEYEIAFKKEDDKIIISEKHQSTILKIDPEQFQNWNEMIMLMTKMKNELIGIRKK